MENIIIAFMLLAGVVCLFAIFMIVIDLVKDRRDRREQRQANSFGNVLNGIPVIMQTAATPVAAQTAPEAPVATAAETTEEEPSVVEESSSEEKTEAAPVTEDAEAENNGIWINRASDKTHVEKYGELTDEARAHYDEIKAYALAQKDVAAHMANRYEDIRRGKKRVVRMVIRREVLYCEFVILHSELSSYIASNHVSVKHAPTTIKIDSPEAVIAAKNSVDIALRAIDEERAYRHEQQKKRRREARAASRNINIVTRESK